MTIVKSLFAVLILSDVCFGTVTGPNNPSSESDNSSVGNITWSFPGPNGTFTSNDVRASATLNTFDASHYLVATGFNFSIPSGQVIEGILVEVEKRDGSGSGTWIIDSNVRIVKGGVIGSTNKATVTQWPYSDTVLSYGSYSDLWGETWSTTDINASDFGVALAASFVAGGIPIAEIDHIQISVSHVDPISKKRLWQTQDIFD